MYTQKVELECTRKRICATYAGDMHALELHMLEAFERQLTITQDYHEAHNVVRSLVSTSKQHIEALHRLVSSLGDIEKIVTDKLKSAVAGLFGFAAGIVDTMRPLAASKALRDSYTAIHHAIVGYVMLSTTAVALDNEETRAIADKFLDDWIELSRCVMCVIPALVLRDLSEEGIVVNDPQAPRKIKENKQLSFLFHKESLSVGDPLHENHPLNLQPLRPNLTQPPLWTTLPSAPPAPAEIVVQKKSGNETGTTVRVEPPVVSKITKPVIVEETFHVEKVIEVQPVIHREIKAPEIHHIEKHVYEKVAAGPAVVTNKPIIEEVIKPQITEEVQEIIHREIPAPFIEKVEKLTDEFEVMPTLHTKEVIREQERVVKADLVVKNVPSRTENEIKLADKQLLEGEKIPATPKKVTEIEKIEKISEVKKTTATTPGFAAGGPPPKGTSRSAKKAH